MKRNAVDDVYEKAKKRRLEEAIGSSLANISVPAELAASHSQQHVQRMNQQDASGNPYPMQPPIGSAVPSLPRGRAFQTGIRGAGDEPNLSITTAPTPLSSAAAAAVMLSRGLDASTYAMDVALRNSLSRGGPSQQQQSNPPATSGAAGISQLDIEALVQRGRSQQQQQQQQQQQAAASGGAFPSAVQQQQRHEFALRNQMNMPVDTDRLALLRSTLNSLQQGDLSLSSSLSNHNAGYQQLALLQQQQHQQQQQQQQQQEQDIIQATNTLLRRHQAEQSLLVNSGSLIGGSLPIGAAGHGGVLQNSSGIGNNPLLQDLAAAMALTSSGTTSTTSVINPHLAHGVREAVASQAAADATTRRSGEQQQFSLPGSRTPKPNVGRSLLQHTLEDASGAARMVASSDQEQQHRNRIAVLRMPLRTDTTLHHSQRLCVMLATDEDQNWLSEYLCFVRANLVEVFRANHDDVRSRNTSKKVTLGQVGIRCKYCAHLPQRARSSRSSSYPSSLSRIYQSLTMMLRDHFGKCGAVPLPLKARFLEFKGKTSQGATDSKHYWVYSAKQTGLIDSDEGIWVSDEAAS